jgi:hypothetical protein
LVFAGHGYGHRKGRGNRYNHVIDDTILNYIVEDQLSFDRINVDPKWENPPYVFRPHSSNELYRVVRDRYKRNVSKEKVLKHLDGLAEDHLLEKSVKAGERNKTFFWLPQTKLIDEMTIRFRLITPDGTVIG